MIDILERLEVADFLKLNAALQSKKSQVRKDLTEAGVIKKDKTNTFDKYSYFSEAGYKQLFTRLFSNHMLELTANEVAYEAYDTTSEKQPNGRRVTFEFILTDVETGFFERSIISGEGIDKGDKAGYKADTGALKYYLANTFMVATGDDPENDSPEAKPAKASFYPGKITDAQIKIIEDVYRGENMYTLLKVNNLTKLEDMTKAKASEIISELKKRREAQNNG